jgi:hypothetical protein
MLHIFRQLSFIFLALILVAEQPANSVFAASAKSETGEDKPFKASADVMADIDAVLAKAKSAGKLGMVVMGANWCHDSRAFVRHLKSAEMQPVLANSYEVILVDVGPLSKVRDVITRFGMPVIYGTPTVLVVDPDSQQQLNRHDMHQWRNAYSISHEDTADHFRKMANAEQRGAPASVHGDTAKAAFAQIDAFENQQAERIYKGFDLIGPMIVKERDERPDNFEALWNELRDFRYQITEDLKALRDNVRAAEAAGNSEISLNYPIYERFSWEKTAE